MSSVDIAGTLSIVAGGGEEVLVEIIGLVQLLMMVMAVADSVEQIIVVALVEMVIIFVVLMVELVVELVVVLLFMVVVAVAVALIVVALEQNLTLLQQELVALYRVEMQEQRNRLVSQAQEVSVAVVAVIMVVVVVQLVRIVVLDKEVVDHLGQDHLLVQYFKAELDQEMDKLLLVGNNLIIFKRADTAPPMDLPR